MYLQALDEHHDHLSQVEQVAAATRALRDENFAIKHALKSKGLVLGPILDPPPPPKEQYPGNAGSLPTRPTGKAAMAIDGDENSSIGRILKGLQIMKVRQTAEESQRVADRFELE